MRSAPGRRPGGRPRASPPLAYFEALLAAYGPQRWWPARTAFEVVVGAILTQRVAWRNVEAAIGALSREGLLDPVRMARVPRERLARLLRPAGFFNQKARTLQALLRHLREAHGGDLGRCLRQPLPRLRAELLGIGGIGPETADAIVLYAAGLPSFVVDAYTVRVLRRHGLLRGDEPYEEAQRAIAAGLPRDPRVYNEFHALLVRVAKDRCLKTGPRCDGCPLEAHLPQGGPEPDPAGPPGGSRRTRRIPGLRRRALRPPGTGPDCCRNPPLASPRVRPPRPRGLL